MENYFFPLKRFSATWISSSSTSWVIETILGFLCGVGLFLLLLPYLQSNPSHSTPKKDINNKKPQAETKKSRKRNKSEAVKDLSTPPPVLPPSPPQPSDVFACLQPPTSASPLPHTSLNLSQSDSMVLPLNPLSANPLPNNCWLASVPVAKSLEPSNRSISTLSWWQATSKTLGFSTLKDCDSQQKYTSCHTPDDALGGNHTDRSTETGNPTFSTSDVQKLLEIQVTKRIEFKIWEEKEQDGSFPNQISSDYHLNSLRNMLKSLGDEQNAMVSQPMWRSKGTSQQVLSSHKTLQDLQQKYSQLFWGLPFLHSESLVATVRVAGSSLEHPSVLFNGISNALPIPTQAKVSPSHYQTQCLPYQVAQIQPSISTMSQSQVPHLAQSRAHLQPSLSFLPSSLPRGVCGPTDCHEEPSLSSTRIHRLEWPLLPEQSQSRKALPSVATRSQETITRPLSRVNLPQESWSSEAHKSDTIIPRDFISPELRKQLEQHLQKRIIHHQHGLPHRIQEFLELTKPLRKLSTMCQAEDHNGTPWPSTQTSESNKEVQGMGSRHHGRPRHSENFHVCGVANFQLGSDLGKGRRRSLEEIPRHKIPWRSETCQGRVLEVNSEKEPKNNVIRHSRNNSGNYIVRDPQKKQLENTLNAHLSRKSGQIIENSIPVDVRKSWLAVNHILSKSDTNTKNGNLVSLEGQASCVNTTRGLSFLNVGTRWVLESHIVKFWVRHRWCLPLKVLKLIKLFKAKKDSPSPPLKSTFSSSTTLESLADSRAEAAKFWEENPQTSWGEKVTPLKSALVLESPVPTSSPASEEDWKTLACPSPVNDRGFSEILRSGQEFRQPFDPLTSSILERSLQNRALLRVQRGSLLSIPNEAIARIIPRKENVGCTCGSPRPSVAMLTMHFNPQSSKAEEIGEASVAEVSSGPQLQDRDTWGTSMLATSQNRNVELRALGPSGASKRSPSPKLADQDLEETCFISPGVSEFGFKLESESENPSQDCSTKMLLQDYAREVLVAADNLICQISQSRPHSVSSGDISASYELIEARRSGLEQQESQLSNLQDPWKNQGEIFAHSHEKIGSPKLGKYHRGFAQLEAPQSSVMSQLSQAKGGVGDMPGNKHLQIPPEKGKAPAESHFRKRMKHFLQWIFPSKKASRKDDTLPKGKPVPNSAPDQEAVKSTWVFTDREVTEAQALMTAVGQILEDKIVLHASKSSEQKEEIQESQALNPA
ncbi:spermatogenesis-associated protein 31A6 [Echinops telfairi]|uniref:Spermatogenesis-associated protein 31A6 n=1 Tax=Echinops telfairi TaxID=9371 RepID=A0AC55DG01_ECHTE|nr:spermatogenesis-associated protein 31A6 [Echinops telfairi]